MKRILITGANSYIGTSFEKYMEKFRDEYQVDTIDLIDGSWRGKSFSDYDVIFHVAGIAHRKETKANANLYFEVNRDLAVSIAQKAKKEGVKHFVFLSSMSIYGKETGVISKETLPDPISNYGKSKWQAEEKIRQLQDEDFFVCCLRPPMVYGKGCKGNYNALKKLATKLPLFPYVANKRSMIYIDNLNNFVYLMIKNKEAGVFCPQNCEYSNTSEMVKEIAKHNGKNIKIVKGFSWIIKFFALFSSKIRKAFGSLYYEGFEPYKENYFVFDFNQSIQETEGRESS